MKAYDEWLKKKQLKKIIMKKETKENKEFAWTDELVKEFVTGYYKSGQNYYQSGHYINVKDPVMKEIDFFKKSKEKEKPRFIADDGVGIYWNDIYYQVLADWSVKAWRSDFGRPNDAMAAFSTEQAAKEYVVMNQPRYSITEIDRLYDKWLSDENFIHFKYFLIKEAK